MASPITVIGEWDNGIVVDKYTETSMYIGDDAFGHPQFQTTYSKIGKLLHAMKYNGHFDTSEEIANICIDTLGGWFTGKKIDIILPAPPSTERPSQPVYMVAEVLASKLGIFYSDEVLVKTSAIPAKNMPKDSKSLKGTILQCKPAKRPCNILLVDDFYSTGETANECVSVLRRDPMIEKIFYLAIAKTK